MATYWVLVANSSEARIFAVDSAISPLQEVTQLSHPASRMAERELTSDLPGRAFDSNGPGRHVMEQKTPAKRQQAIGFAREISGYLSDALGKESFTGLMLVAAPAFLGLLREKMDAEVSKRIVKEIAKDWVTMDPTTLGSQFPDGIWRTFRTP